MLKLTLIILAIIIVMSFVTSMTDSFDGLAFVLYFILFIPALACIIWIISKIPTIFTSISNFISGYGIYILYAIGAIIVFSIIKSQNDRKYSKQNLNNQSYNNQIENTISKTHNYLTTEKFDSKNFTDGHIAMLKIAKRYNYNMKGLMNYQKPIYSLILFNYYTTITKPNRLSVEDIYLFCSIHPFKLDKKESVLKNYVRRDGFNNYETRDVIYDKSLDSISDSDVNKASDMGVPPYTNIDINTTDSNEFKKLECAILNNGSQYNDYDGNYIGYNSDYYYTYKGEKTFNNLEKSTYSFILTLINDMDIDINQFIHGKFNKTSITINEIGEKIGEFIKEKESKEKSIRDADERKKAIKYIQSN